MAEPTPAPSLPNDTRFFLLNNPWLYPLLACFVVLILFSLRKITSYDLGFHLKTGQWILQHFAYPQKDTYTYTQTDRDYLDSNGLFQILLFFLFKTFGYSALTLLNTCLIGLVFWLLLSRLKMTQTPSWVLPTLFLTAILTMERRFLVRPEIFSWLYLSGTLWILENRFRRMRNLLFLLPLIQFFWVNTEGLFMLGWAVMAAYWISGRVHEKRFDPLLSRYFLLSVAADLLNPYGIRGFLFPFRLLTRLQGSNLFKQVIGEFRTPWQSLTANQAFDSEIHLYLFFVLSLLTVFLIAMTFRQRKFHEFLLLAVFLALACAAIRNIPLFILIAIPILSACLADWKTIHGPVWLSGLKLAVFLFLLICLLGTRVATNAYYITDRRNERIGWGVDDQTLPVKAAQYLVQNHLDGKMLNDLNTGGWLDWQAPQPTFIDGRLEVPDDSFYRQTMETFKPGGLIPLLAITQAELVVMEYNTAMSWADQLNRTNNWRLIYLDECTAIYAREDYAPQIPILSLTGLLRSRQIADQDDATVEAQLRGLPLSRFDSWLNGFYQSQTYQMGDFSMGLFALRTKNYQAARDLFMEGLRGTTGVYGEVFFNLAVANLRLQNFSLGKLCLDDTLAIDPQNSSALQMKKSLNL